jgi:putative spermidine/putrescine transport system permease protein/spermidine/putrescine transport system permease protein
MLPFWTSILVRTYAWLVLLQRQGLVNTWGIKLGLWDEPLALVHNLSGPSSAWCTSCCRSSCCPCSARCARSTATISRLRPISAPARHARSGRCSSAVVAGVFAGALIVFIICLGFYVTPAVLGGGKVILVSNQIASDIELFFNWGAASALGVVLLVLTLAFLAIASEARALESVVGR